jgi:hypothetical protein
MTLLLCVAPGAASAVIPEGHFEIGLGASQSIWLDDAAGENEFCDGFAEGFGGTLQSCEFEMFVDAKGKITGSVAVAALNGNLAVELEGPIKGKLKGDSQQALTDLSFSAKLAGSVGDGVMTTALDAKVGFAGQIDLDGDLFGEWNTKICSKAAGCVEEIESSPSQAFDGGSWLLALDIADLGGGKLGGSAEAELSDGTTCPYEISGKYSSKSDTASLKLSPTSQSCDGTSISLKDVRVAATLAAQMKYKLFGFKGDVPVESFVR